MYICATVLIDHIYYKTCTETEIKKDETKMKNIIIIY